MKWKRNVALSFFKNIYFPQKLIPQSKKPVKNADLWRQLDEAVSKHRVTWHWVKGHSGHPENERCDTLARAAAESPSQPDTGFNSDT